MRRPRGGPSSGITEFYKRAFGADEKSRFTAPDGKSIWHVELKIGDSMFFMNDEMPGG